MFFLTSPAGGDTLNPMNSFLTHVINTAFDEAFQAMKRGEVPVGAVIFSPETEYIAAVASNRVEEDRDPTAHAEILALRQACAATNETRLTDFDIYVTLEPCPMCAAAISFARIRRLYFGAYDPKGGGVEHGCRVYGRKTCHHAPEVYGGIGERKAAALLKDFFLSLR